MLDGEGSTATGGDGSAADVAFTRGGKSSAPVKLSESAAGSRDEIRAKVVADAKAKLAARGDADDDGDDDGADDDLDDEVDDLAATDEDTDDGDEESDDEDGEEGSKEEETPPVDVKETPEYKALAKEAETAKKDRSEMAKFLTDSIAYEEKLEDDVSDLMDELVWLRDQAVALGWQPDPTQVKLREYERAEARRTREAERNTKKSTSTVEARQKAEYEAMQARLDATSRVHGVDPLRLAVAIRSERDLARIEKRKERDWNALALEIKGPVAPAKAGRDEAPSVLRGGGSGRSGRAADYPQTREGNAAWARARAKAAKAKAGGKRK